VESQRVGEVGVSLGWTNSGPDENNHNGPGNGALINSSFSLVSPLRQTFNIFNVIGILFGLKSYVGYNVSRWSKYFFVEIFTKHFR
jgi:hypothetical protein